MRSPGRIVGLRKDSAKDRYPVTAVDSDAGPRNERFGYQCHRCLRCCRDKRIQLDPYEVARLARNQGMTTTEFRRTATVGGRGVELARTADNACVFLGSEGCTVHADRPLACRIYPLGRAFSPERGERFEHVEPHPLSAGEWHTRGTIGDFLREQGAEPYIAAADAYLAWLNAALTQLRAAGLGDAAVAAAPFDDSELLDMDAALAAHGDTADDIEVRRDLHLAILHRQLVPA